MFSELIEYKGPNDVLIWKHPNEEILTTAQLIVRESQQAILVQDGRIIKTYLPGRHTIKSPNIPILEKALHILSDGPSPFKTEVYFVDLGYDLNLFWGTNRPISFQDSKFKVIMDIRSNGQYAVRVENPIKLFKELLRTTTIIDNKVITTILQGPIQSVIVQTLADYLTNKQLNFIQIQSYLRNVAHNASLSVNKELEKYGLKLVNFFVNSISIPPEDEGFKTIKKALTDQALSKSDRYRRQLEGITIKEEKAYDVLLAQATNPGVSGTMAGLGIGVGVGAVAGQGYVNMFNNMMSPVFSQPGNTDQWGNPIPSSNPLQNEPIEAFPEVNPINPFDQVNCPHCGVVIKNPKKICPECGELLGDIFEKICPKCQKKSRSRANFCEECGYQFGENE